MINLICTHCQNAIEIDDAFAGGVCRCKHCGTIQTVPRAGVAAKTLYKQRVRPETVGSSGLEDLANVVTSSGLDSGRLRSHAPGSATPPSNRAAVLLGIAGGIIFLLVLAVVILWMRGTTPQPVSQSASEAQASVGAPVAVETPKPQSPNFLGIPIDETTIIYVLDRGDSSREIFGHLKNAAYKSIESLGPSRRFQILFWNNGEDAGFPMAGPVTATAENLNAARKALEDIAAFGKTDIIPALKKATPSHPGVIIIATGKAWDLDDSFAQQVISARGEWPIKMHTLAVGDPGTGNALKMIAEKTGGQYLHATATELKEYAGQ